MGKQAKLVPRPEQPTEPYDANLTEVALMTSHHSAIHGRVQAIECGAKAGLKIVGRVPADMRRDI
jgi:hypothetical protein